MSIQNKVHKVVNIMKALIEIETQKEFKFSAKLKYARD